MEVGVVETALEELSLNGYVRVCDDQKGHHMFIFGKKTNPQDNPASATDQKPFVCRAPPGHAGSTRYSQRSSDS